MATFARVDHAALAPSGGRRPGWWATILGLLLGGATSSLALLVFTWPLSRVAGVPRVGSGADDQWPFFGSDAGVLAANAAEGMVALAVLTVAFTVVLRRTLSHPVAPTWVAAALGLGGYGAGLVGVLGPGNGLGLIVAILVVRFAGFYADGQSRPGAFALIAPAQRSRATASLAVVILLAAFGVAAYGAAHPVAAARTTGTVAYRVPGRPARAFDLHLEQRGHARVTVLGITRAAGLAGAVPVLAFGGYVGRNGDPLSPAPLIAGSFGTRIWLHAPSCPSPATDIDRLTVQTRSWAGTHTTMVRLRPPLEVACLTRMP